MTAEDHIDFWFDPACPFTWRTSRWLHEVAGQRPIGITWRLMSLSVLNADKEIPEQYREPIRQGARALRVLAAAAEAGGQDAVGRLYTALGTRRHEQGKDYEDGVLQDAVAEVGLPASVAAAAGDERYDAAVLASHEEGQRRVGAEVGSPVTAVGGGRGFFGPVVVPVPTGAEALRLLDAVRLLASVPSFSELKGARASF
jgi:predicted DsbA family dithiol-disulfide isomerase